VSTPIGEKQFWLLQEFKVPGTLREQMIELSKHGFLDPDEFIAILQQSAIAHREAGDPEIGQALDASHNPSPYTDTVPRLEYVPNVNAFAIDTLPSGDAAGSAIGT
jgi:hypothetical protein